jgi:predicted enzyme related to lactoylglutathione lyase
MAEIMASAVNKPVWIDLASSDPAASREFYANLFDWQVEVNPDPNYGGYALAKVGGKEVAGIGPKMMPEAPTAWSVYIGTGDVAALATKVQASGGKVIAPPMQVGDQGSMAVFQDPSGAYIGAWQPDAMGGFVTGVPGSYAWAELNSRGLDRAVPFYAAAFGWATRTSPMGEGQPPYTEFLLEGHGVAGGMEMSPMVPAAVPSYWMVYFAVDDVDGAFKKALAAGAKVMVAVQDFPGGRFAIVQDPQGAVFALHNRPAR